MNTRTTILLFFLLAVPSTLLHAQNSDTILPNPNAVLLRKIWMVRGETTGPNAGGRIGDGAGSLPDINGDSLTDFAVRFGKADQWRIYLGTLLQPDTIPFWMFTADSTSPVRPPYPLWGKPKADGNFYIGFGQDRFHDTPEQYLLYLFRVSNGCIEDIPTDTLDPLRTMDPPTRIAPKTGYMLDLDRNNADELVLVSDVLVRNKQRSTNAEVWFYKGGPDFQVKQPTKIIVDAEENDDHPYSTAFADLDGDRYVDMAIGCGYPTGRKLKIWYGREGSPWNWTSTPDRVIPLSNTIGLNMPLTFADYDGDSILDFAGRVFQIENPGVFIYLSGSGKNFRTRSFSLDDAEVYFRTSEYGPLGSVGYLNDPRRKHQMLALYGHPPQPLLFSATKDGIDPYYDAYFAGGLEELMGYKIRVPLSDCNGDGWGDFLTADDSWWGFNQGIAVIFAGGPYIPHDDPTVDVQDLSAEGKSNAISIWPNPVRDVLNIAWHGRLQHPPARLAIHDMNGKLVASGVTDPSVGAMIWNADGVAAGTYLLTVYDRDGGVIVSKRCIKQE